MFCRAMRTRSLSAERICGQGNSEHSPQALPSCNTASSLPATPATVVAGVVENASSRSFARSPASHSALSAAVSAPSGRHPLPAAQAPANLRRQPRAERLCEISGLDMRHIDARLPWVTPKAVTIHFGLLRRSSIAAETTSCPSSRSLRAKGVISQPPCQPPATITTFAIRQLLVNALPWGTSSPAAVQLRRLLLWIGSDVRPLPIPAQVRRP